MPKLKLTSGITTNMTPLLKISQKLLDRLAQYECGESLGKLYGIFAKNDTTILGVQLINDQDHDLTCSFPAEVEICGIIRIGQDYDEYLIKKHLNNVDVTDNPVFLHYKPSTKEIQTTFYINDKLEPIKYDSISQQEVLDQFLHIRLQACLPMSCELNYDTIKENFLNLRKLVSSGAMAFKFSKTNIYLLDNNSENGIVGVSGNPSIGELCDTSDPNEGGGKKKKTSPEMDILDVEMLKLATKSAVNGTQIVNKEHAPLCILDKKQCKTISFITKIDALAMLHRQTKIVDLYQVLVESTIRNLRLCENVLLKYLNDEDVSTPEVFHFYPQELGHFVTLTYLRNYNNANLKNERQLLHEQIMLPLNHPQFRRANQYVFKGQIVQTGPLIDPHENVKSTNNNGKICLVKGKYSYYHYGQNQMDDNGWGCAYRSLQTLASWFKWQGYIDDGKQVPTFEDIQKCLVDIGDKSKDFIGSKQWIGSTEVSYVLDSLLGITSKILYVSAGDEMATKGPELVHHFEMHGSPIMIGGGVLAHTILGVDYNSQTGDIKFLILDPHYTGNEDLNVIQNKGWCGWKGVEFWDKNAYYNMCLPQVPLEV